MGNLVLSRRVGETIIISDNIKVTVLQSKGNTVRLSIDAPLDIEIHRSEIYDRIQREKLGINNNDDNGGNC